MRELAHPRLRRVLAALLTALVLLAVLAGEAASAVPPAPMVDFRGRTVPASRYAGKVVVYFVCGRHSNRQMDSVTRPFGEALGQEPRVGYLTVIDLRSVPRLFSPFVTAALGRVHRDSVHRINRWRREDGLAADPGLQDRFTLVTDWDGRLQGALGSRHRDRDVEMVVVDGSGEPVGVWRGPGGVAAMIDAVRRVLAATADTAGKP